jgi:NAD(P)-dependent dehydrogenase (short-subunit alcohol dehydrogenase family)
MSLQGKTAIVTGASRGIGKQLAIELGRLGANVVVAARTVEQRRSLPGTIGETVAMIEEAGGTGLAVAADMANEADLERLVAATVERFGGIDLLVNNAAATAGKDWGASLADLTREGWMGQYAVNLHAPFTLMRAVAPVMATRGAGSGGCRGRIINVTTGRHGHDESTPAPGLNTPLAYPSSKAALDQLCISVAPQLRAQGVMVVNVNPGFVRTEMVDLMEANGVDASASISITIPTAAMMYLATCDEPMRYAGKILEAEDLVNELDLLS